MIRRFTSLLFACFLFGALGFQTQAQNNYFPDQLIVQLETGAEAGLMVERFNQQFAGAQMIPVRQLSKRLNIWLVEFEEQAIDVNGALDFVKADREVLIAQHHHHSLETRVLPNDTDFSAQWGFHNDGTNGGNGQADISADSAWDITTGGTTARGDDIVVAVIDGNFDLTHEDLNFFKNTNEIPNNNIDDDGNGYIDDYDGWNAYNSSGNFGFQSQYHGTHVSGTVGAIGNNGIGVTGVNWNVQVLPVRGSSGQEATVVEAYSYVLEMRATYNATSGASGAYVVSTNSSFGVNYGDPANYPIWCAMYDSLGAYGVLSAGATANLNIDIDVEGDIPTACSSDYMIAVTNTRSNDAKNNGAAYGLTTIDLGAPGTDIYSTAPGNQYDYSTGTSMATPHVAGAIALMYSGACLRMFQDYENDPAGMALLIRNYLLNSGVDQVPSLTNNTVTGGRLNLYKALLALDTYDDCTPIGVEEVLGSGEKFDVFPNPSQGNLNLRFEVQNSTQVEFRLMNMLGSVSNRFAVSAVAGENQVEMDRSELANGIYLLEMLIDGERIGSKKVVLK